MLTRTLSRQIFSQIYKAGNRTSVTFQHWENPTYNGNHVKFTPQVRFAKRVAYVERVILHKEIIDKERRKQAALEAVKEQEKLEDQGFSEEHVREIILDQKQDLQRSLKVVDINDLPLPGLPNPYEKPHKKCLLCENDVQLDYKNTRLLSQFVSPYTGQIYGRNVTGLCLFMQKRIAKLIKRSRYFGLMPYLNKQPSYLEDPKLFDPFKKKY